MIFETRKWRLQFKSNVFVVEFTMGAFTLAKIGYHLDIPRKNKRQLSNVSI